MKREVLENDLLLKAALGLEVERTPVWVMRQAGRILKEYRDVRASVSGFKELVTTPALAAEVTMQPVDLLGVDAAIIFSDILVIPEALGLDYQMIEKKGPWFEKTISTTNDLASLNQNEVVDKLAYVTDAIKITKKLLNNKLPLIGFAGAPWTIFSYMVEGSGSKTFSVARKMLYTNPKLSHELLEIITMATISYLKAQIKAGTNLVQIFDSWAGILPPDQYNEFGLHYIEEICKSVNEVPITVFAKGAYGSFIKMNELSCNTIGLDWLANPKDVRKQIGHGKTLQGNLDPCLLYADYNTIKKETIKMLESFGPNKHIANLGHGVYPDTDPDKVKFFINTVKEYKF